MVAAIFRLRPGAVRLFAFLLAGATLTAQPFQPPTANHALFEPGGEERFFTGTAGKPPASGCYGCVRSDGWQMHEGLDILHRQTDRRGDPTDPVLATADGTVAYCSRKPSLSNYGNYINCGVAPVADGTGMFGVNVYKLDLSTAGREYADFTFMADHFARARA